MKEMNEAIYESKEGWKGTADVAEIIPDDQNNADWSPSCCTDHKLVKKNRKCIQADAPAPSAPQTSLLTALPPPLRPCPDHPGVSRQGSTRSSRVL